MNQNYYRARIIKRFMSEEESADFDLQYQAMKEPTANNLPNKVFDTYMQKLEAKVIAKLKKKKNFWSF